MARPESARLASDVAVIGAGICGTTLGAILAREGVRVTIYEREAVAAGASGRNSGVVQRPLDPVLVPLYEATVAIYRELADEAPDAGFMLPAEPAGLLLVTFEADGLPTLATRLGVVAPELDPVVLEGPELRALEAGLADGVAAVRLSIGYPIVPASPTYAMATLAERRGATIRLGRTVRPSVDDGRVGGVELDGRVEPAGTVIVAAGPSSPKLIDPTGAWRPIRPVWGVVVETLLAVPPRHVLEEASIDAVVAQMPGSVESAARAGPSPRVDFSLVPAGEVCAVGSTFLDEEPEPGPWGERILENARRFVPALYEAPIREIRACARPASIDGRPVLGPIPWIEGLHICSGHGSWGISTGPGSAALVADVLLGRQPSPPSDLGSTRLRVSIR
jgi:glycine/D-amino acid oxidase-like deaminating enzyme